MAKREIEVLGWMDFDGNKYRFEPRLTWDEFKRERPDEEIIGLNIRDLNKPAGQKGHIFWVYEANDWNDSNSWEAILKDIDVAIDRYGLESV